MTLSVHCHLFIPDFFADTGIEAGDRLGAIETLIARGRRKRLRASSSEAWLFERFQVRKQRDWPVAPYSLLGDGGAPGPHFWIRADPVHLQVGNNKLVLIDSTAFDVSRAESEALVETLNRHFGETLLFYPLRPARWYMRLPQAPELETTPPSTVRGMAIDGYLPSGGDAMRFQALTNETQMLLHEHPVNAAREARGALALNSVWFWGGGAIDAATARPFSAVIGDDPLARGLALAAGNSARPLPKDAGSMLAAAEDKGLVLVVLGALQDAAGNADGARFRERRAALERDWFEPLLAALESGRIGMLTLSLSGPDSLLEIEIVRSDLRYFWRLRKPLASYLSRSA